MTHFAFDCTIFMQLKVSILYSCRNPDNSKNAYIVMVVTLLCVYFYLLVHCVCNGGSLHCPRYTGEFTAIISLLATTLAIYLLCKHKKLRTLLASLVLYQVKEVGAVTQKEIDTECKTLTYISLALTILGLIMIPILHYRKSKLCRGRMFSNAVKIMIFISDVQYYVPIKLCKTVGSIHLFKIIGMLKPENIKLN